MEMIQAAAESVTGCTGFADQLEAGREQAAVTALQVATPAGSA